MFGETPREQAAVRRREIRADRLRRCVLAGGWGIEAQAKAWDEELPDWAHWVNAVIGLNRHGVGEGPGPWEQLGGRLNARCRRLARPWYRLLMQTMNRRHDEAPWGRRWRFGGYPIR